MRILVKGKYGSVTNNYGVVITKREMNRWRDAIPKANRVIAQEKRIRRTSPLKYAEFAMEMRNSDLGRFKTKQAFLSYLKTAEQIARGTFFRQKAIQYRQNYIKSLEINFGSLADKLVKRIKRMRLADFRRLVESDKLYSIGFIYFETEGEATDRINALMEQTKATDVGHGYVKGRARNTRQNRAAIKDAYKSGDVTSYHYESARKRRK